MIATVKTLVKLKEHDKHWVVTVESDLKTQQFCWIFWMSPWQVELVQKFGDVIINDITYQHNKYRLPLNIWMVIDH